MNDLQQLLLSMVPRVKNDPELRISNTPRSPVCRRRIALQPHPSYQRSTETVHRRRRALLLSCGARGPLRKCCGAAG